MDDINTVESSSTDTPDSSTQGTSTVDDQLSRPGSSLETPEADAKNDASRAGDKEGDANDDAKTEEEETEEGEPEPEQTPEEKQKAETKQRFDTLLVERGKLRESVQVLQKEVEAAKESKAELDRIKEDLAQLGQLARFSPKVREFMESFFIQGREPKDDEIDDIRGYYEWKAQNDARAIARREAASAQEAVARESAQKRQNALREEGKKLLDDPQYAKFLTPEKLDDAVDLLVAWAAKKGDAVLDTAGLKNAVAFLYNGEVEKVHKEAGRKEATSKIKKRAPGMRPGAPGQPANKKFRDMTLREQIESARAEIRAGKSG
jgi:hypothetical protein